MDEAPTTANGTSNVAENEETEKSQLMSKAQREKTRRGRSLRIALTGSQVLTDPTAVPCTPCSVFSFELPHSATVVQGRPNFTRSTSQCEAPVAETPRSLFSFDIFELGYPRSPPPTYERAISSPAPKTPKTPRVPDLPTIEESRSSFSFPPTFDEEEEEKVREESSVYSEHEPEQKTDWSSINLVRAVILLTRIQFTVYFASLWPFLQEIDPTATTEDFAYMNAVYSIGLAISAPLFGFWSNRLGCIRIPSLCSMILMLVSNLMFCFLHIIPGYGKYAMGVARLISGIAAGGNSLLPTYWTYAAAPSDRSTAAAMFDEVFCLGIFFGPGFQFLSSLIGYPGISLWFFRINTYTSPAILAIILVLLSAVLMMFCFNEAPMMSKDTKRGSIDSTGSETSKQILPPADKIAVILCIATKMVQMFIYANMETIAAMFTQRMFDLTLTATTQFNSILMACSGLVGCAFLRTYVWTKLGKKIDNRNGVVVGILICMGFLLATFSWPFYEGTITSPECKYVWCASTQPIPKWLYAISYVLVFGFGYALINVHLAAMYCQVLGPRRQGTMHGINTFFASLSRILGPVFVTYLFTMYGPQLVWTVQFSVWSSLISPLLIFRRRLLPLQYIKVEDVENGVKHEKLVNSEEK